MLPLAIAVVIVHAGRVLLIRRAAHRPLGGYWTPVTGRLEPGESLEAACHREVSEEVGLSIELGPSFHHGTTSDGLFDLTYFVAQLSAGATSDLRLQRDEVSDARWVDPRDLDCVSPILDTTRHVLSKLLASELVTP